MEIVVDAYNEEEIGMGWYYYLENHLSFPFRARTITKQQTSAAKPPQEVEVLEMSSEDECLQEMFVKVRWEDDILTTPLDVDAETKEGTSRICKKRALLGTCSHSPQKRPDRYNTKTGCSLITSV